jgi:hypothetical protein
MSKFSDLQGQTLVRIVVGYDEITFIADTGQQWRMYHDQDCCEHVSVEEVIGDTADLIGTPIIVAEERESTDAPDGFDMSVHDSCTWTFYEMRTIKGSVTIRWLGESNGYYSESVDFASASERYEPADDETWTVAGDRMLARGQSDIADRYRHYFALGGT